VPHVSRLPRALPPHAFRSCGLQVGNAELDVISALFSTEVGNAGIVILIMMVMVGWCISAVDRSNPHLGTISRGSYWGLMSFLSAAETTPQSKLGRMLNIVWLLTNLISLSVIQCVALARYCCCCYLPKLT
jgi:hypothetical protein